MKTIAAKYLSDRRWARRFVGGKWELWGSRWTRVQEWSEPRTQPEVYSLGAPIREDWG